MQLYCVTAVRFIGGYLTAVEMGVADRATNKWASPPKEVEVIEVVDRITGGDDVVSIFPVEGGGTISGPALRVVMRDNGIETVDMVGYPIEGRRLTDMPRF